MADFTAISTAISTRICSQLKRVRSVEGDSDGDSDVDHDLQALDFLSKSVFKHPARPQSSRGGSSLRRSSPGSHPDASAPPLIICAPNLGRGLGPGSRVSRMSRGCSDDTSTIRAQSEQGRAQSEQGSSIVFRALSLRTSALSRLETLCADDTSTAGSSTALHATLRALRPSPRPDGSTYGTHGGVTGPHGRKSPMGVTAWVTGTHGRKSPLGIRAGDSIPEDSFRSRSHSMLSRNGSRSQGSLSTQAPRPVPRAPSTPPVCRRSKVSLALGHFLHRSLLRGCSRPIRLLPSGHLPHYYLWSCFHFNMCCGHAPHGCDL